MDQSLVTSTPAIYGLPFRAAFLFNAAGMNPYRKFVFEYARLAKEGKDYPLGGFPKCPRPRTPAGAPNVLVFSPHPDDECITGGLALRLLREARMNVHNVAVTLGSKKERQAERWGELESACNFLGFGLISTGAFCLENINLKTRAQNRKHWLAAVGVVAGILQKMKPAAIFLPHQHDWNSTHIGTHFLVFDALKRMPVRYDCFLFETEYWGQMTDPNLMIESGADDVTDLVSAASFHAGEMRRNPFHLLLPAWMQDNVRRGSEVVGGQGEAAPDFTFATLYRLRKWHLGKIIKILDAGKQISCQTNPGKLFA